MRDVVSWSSPCNAATVTAMVGRLILRNFFMARPMVILCRTLDARWSVCPFRKLPVFASASRLATSACLWPRMRSRTPNLLRRRGSSNAASGEGRSSAASLTPNSRPKHSSRRGSFLTVSLNSVTVMTPLPSRSSLESTANTSSPDVSAATRELISIVMIFTTTEANQIRISKLTRDQ